MFSLGRGKTTKNSVDPGMVGVRAIDQRARLVHPDSLDECRFPDSPSRLHSERVRHIPPTCVIQKVFERDASRRIETRGVSRIFNEGVLNRIRDYIGTRVME